MPFERGDCSLTRLWVIAKLTKVLEKRRLLSNSGGFKAGGVGKRYRRTSISWPKKTQITFPLRYFFPLKVVE
jgi:hypothetical protein